jgi:hypothetical protein
LVTRFSVRDLKGEHLRMEDEKFRAYLNANSWDGEMGEDDLKALPQEGVEPALVAEVAK